MNNKSLLIFVVGAAVGGVATYFATKTRLEELNREDIKQFKEDWNNRCNSCPRNASVSSPEASGRVFEENSTKSSSKDEKSHSEANTSSDILKFQRTDERKDYSKIVENYGDEEADPAEKEAPEEENGNIKFLTEDEYLSDEGDYAKVDFTYYEDDVLTDEDDDEVNRYLYFDDVNIAESFGHDPGAPDAFFIRNESLRMDIQVTRLRGKYHFEED